MIESIKTLIKRSIPYTWRVPRVYWDATKIGEGINTAEEIEFWQLKKLQTIVAYAYQNVPGYHQLYSEHGVTPEDIRSLSDIQLLPIIDKQLIRDNIKDFISGSIDKRKLMPIRTSGSSGHPFGFYHTAEEDWIEQAFVAKCWSQGGWDIKQSGIMLRGAYAGDENHIYNKCDNSSFYVHNDSYLLSANYLTDDYYPVYRNFLAAHQELTYIFAIPSAITLLANLITVHGDCKPLNIKEIMLSSESLYEWQVAEIKKAFPNATIISLYGLTERVIMAYWCRHNHSYHIDPFYGYTETLPVGDRNSKELVGTSFWSKATPFIRYKTGDIVEMGEDACDKCGKNYQLIKSIDGRMQDVLIGKEGRILPYVSFDGSLLHGKVFKDIIQYRIIQEEKGKLLFLLQVSSGFTPDKKDEFCSVIKNYLGNDFECELKIVEKIGLAANGKMNIVEQHLQIK